MAEGVASGGRRFREFLLDLAQKSSTRFHGSVYYSGCPQELTDSSFSGATQQDGEQGDVFVPNSCHEVQLSPPSEPPMAGLNRLARAHAVDETHDSPNTNSSPEAVVAVWEEAASNAGTRDPGHPYS